MVAPGTSSTPPTITRPGSPAACTSTAWITLDVRIAPSLNPLTPGSSSVSPVRGQDIAACYLILWRDNALTIPRRWARPPCRWVGEGLPVKQTLAHMGRGSEGGASVRDV